MIIAPRCIGTVARAWLRNTDEHFIDSWSDMLVFNSRYLEKWPQTYIHYDKGRMSWHAGMRNAIAESMRGEWLFMVDTDHCFGPDLLMRMLSIADRHKCDVLSGTYQFKHQPHTPVINVQHPDAKPEDFMPMPIVEWDRKAEVLPVLTAGAGCLLIRAHVLERIKNELREPPFDNIGSLSEDYSFCKRLKQVGIQLWWAPSIECHHVIPHVLSVRDLAAQ